MGLRKHGAFVNGPAVLAYPKSEDPAFGLGRLDRNARCRFSWRPGLRAGQM